jgi:UDP-glucose 4-epimerase
MAKILVTGGAGFIGSHVVDLFLDRGFEVIILDDLSTGRASNINPNAKFYQMDIRDPGIRKVFELERPDYISHHAAQMDVRRSVAQPLFDAEVNILGSINLIECAKEFNVKHFIYISSGGAAYGEPERLPCDETHPVNPICQYGASKHTVEHYLFMYHANYGMDYTVLRYPNVFGPRQDPNGEAGVVAIFTGKMLASEPVTINGDGEQTRDFVYVGDCAYANYLAVTVPHQAGIYNIGWGCPTSINEIFTTLAKVTAYPHQVSYGPAKVGETRHIYLDATKAGSDLGWSPTLSLEEGLEMTVAYFREKEQAV